MLFVELLPYFFLLVWVFEHGSALEKISNAIKIKFQITNSKLQTNHKFQNSKTNFVSLKKKTKKINNQGKPDKLDRRNRRD